MLYKIDVPVKFAKFTGKHLRWSPFFNKVEGWRPATKLKRRLQHRCFLANFVKFSGTPFLQNISGRLFLILEISRISVSKEYLELFLLNHLAETETDTLIN